MYGGRPCLKGIPSLSEQLGQHRGFLVSAGKQMTHHRLVLTLLDVYHHQKPLLWWIVKLTLHLISTGSAAASSEPFLPPPLFCYLHQLTSANILTFPHFSLLLWLRVNSVAGMTCGYKDGLNRWMVFFNTQILKWTIIDISDRFQQHHELLSA